jgi:hypothetical protein
MWASAGMLMWLFGRSDTRNSEPTRKDTETPTSHRTTRVMPRKNLRPGSNARDVNTRSARQERSIISRTIALHCSKRLDLNGLWGILARKLPPRVASKLTTRRRSIRLTMLLQSCTRRQGRLIRGTPTTMSRRRLGHGVHTSMTNDHKDKSSTSQRRTSDSSRTECGGREPKELRGGYPDLNLLEVRGQFLGNIGFYHNGLESLHLEWIQGRGVSRSSISFGNRGLIT